MKIGDIDLGNRPVMLAPMEDVTDLSLRYGILVPKLHILKLSDE